MKGGQKGDTSGIGNGLLGALLAVIRSCLRQLLVVNQEDIFFRPPFIRFSVGLKGKKESGSPPCEKAAMAGPMGGMCEKRPSQGS